MKTEEGIMEKRKYEIEIILNNGCSNFILCNIYQYSEGYLCMDDAIWGNNQYKILIIPFTSFIYSGHK